MNESIETYWKELEKLSSAELDHGARELVGAERRHVAEVIAHLCEISRRKVYLERGYTEIPLGRGGGSSTTGFVASG